MIDSHIHLSDEKFDEDREEVILNSFSKGIIKFVEVLCSSKEWERKNYFEKYKENFYFSLGIHPHYTNEFNEENLKKLAIELKQERVIAVGETGIDLWYYPDKLNEQLELMETQIELANKYNKLLIFHLRNPRKPQIKMPFIKGKIKTNFKFSGIIHSFSSDVNDAKKAMELGFFIGINATITYPKNNTLRNVVKYAGINNILIETDSPYLPPQKIRGKRNTPLSIIEIVEKISEITGKEKEIIEKTVTESFESLLKIFEN